MGRIKLRPMKKVSKDMARLSLLCGGPKTSKVKIECEMVAEVTFVVLADRKLLVDVLADAGWILSLVSGSPNVPVEGNSPIFCPLCPDCALKLYGQSAYDRALWEIRQKKPLDKKII